MTAEIFDTGTRFEVESETRADGTVGPPARTSVTLRTCWRKPAERFDLELVRVDFGIAFYEISGED